MSHKQAKRDRVQARINAEKQAIQQDVKPVYAKLPEGVEPEKITAVLKENSNEGGMIMPNDSYIPATYGLTSHSGFLVENWKHGWKWISNIALTAIVAVNAAPSLCPHRAGLDKLNCHILVVTKVITILATSRAVRCTFKCSVSSFSPRQTNTA